MKKANSGYKLTKMEQQKLLVEYLQQERSKFEVLSQLVRSFKMETINCCICGKELKKEDSRYIYLEYDTSEKPLYAHLSCHERRMKK